MFRFKGIPSFQPLLLPMIQMDDKLYLDFNSKYFTDDIPFSVYIIKALALLVGVKTPTMNSILLWYRKQTGKEYFLEDRNFGKDIDETA